MPPVIPLQPQLYISFGGSPAPGDLSQAIARLEVDTHLFLPATFSIRLHDEGFRWIEHDMLKIGQEVEISGKASVDEQGTAAPLLSGEVTSIEASYPESGSPTLTVRGYDMAHRLHRGKKVRTFLQMTDSDIAKEIAQERGLQAEADATSHVHEHLYQDNVSDYEFLARRAQAMGFVFLVDGKKLIFKRPSSVALSPVQLDYRSSLLEFRPRITTSAQVNKLSVRGWDPKTKKAIVGRAQPPGQHTSKLGWENHGDAWAKQAFGEATLDLSDEPIRSQAEGDDYASARLASLLSTDVHAEGDAVGNPELRAGRVVRIEGVGTRFGGEYLVTSARHTFTANGEYRTEFTVGGYGPDTTADLLFPESARIEASANSVARGLSIGIVTNNDDPERLGRVKVRFPWLHDETESTWARLAAPMAGDGRGFYFIPEVNDEVLIGFEHGNFNHPYVLGALWNGVDNPPSEGDGAVAGGDVVKRVLKTRAGHIILLDDSRGGEKIEVVDHTGSNKVIIDSAANKITVEAGMEIVMKAGQAIKMEAPNIEITGTASVKVSAPQIESAASARHVIRGGVVEIN